MNLPIFTLAGTLGLLLVGSLTPPTRAWGAAEESFFLDNGLKVIMVDQPGNPVVSLRVMLRTGSSDEKSRPEYGLAHLMEHMAFKGTTRYPDPGSISSLVERNGGDMNAYTSSDSTVYYLNLPADQVYLGLDILADLVFNPLYLPTEYELEKEVVIEEIKRGRDNPDRLLMESFFKSAYPDHPYGRPVIGYEETVQNATVEVAKDFHTRHYRPDNAALVITGGFDRVRVMEAINKFYKTLTSPGKLADRPEPTLAAPTGPVIQISENEKVALAKVFIGFRGPTGRDPDAPIMDLLSSVLSGGKSSRLTEIIKDSKGLVTSISAGSYTPRYQGSFMISMETEPAKVLPALDAVFRELENLVSQPPSDAELARARALAEKDFLTGQESALGLASQITEFENMFGDWRLRDAYLPLWNRTAPSDLTRSAMDYLDPKNMTITVMLPPKKPGDPKYPTEQELATLAKELHLTPASEKINVAPTFQEMPLKSGAKLLVMRDATLPMVTIRAAAMGGLLSEKNEGEGLSNFMALVWSKATSSKSTTELSRAIEDIGASISAFSGRNSVGLSASFLAGSRDEGFRLFAEVLTSPAFNSEDVNKVRPEILAQIKAQDEQLASRTFRLLAQNLYPGDHPYSRNQLGTKESVDKFTPADLKQNYSQLIRPENLVIAVAGDVEPKKVQETLNGILSKWKPTAKGLKISPPKAPQPIGKPTRIEESLDRAQTHIAFGFQAPALGAPEGPALDVLAAYLSGMSGPLFRELRDQQSLAYTVHSGYNPGLGIGSFSFYIATDPQKVEAALAGFKGIIERTRKELITPKELEGAKRYLMGSTKIRSQTVASRTSQILFNDLYGLGLDYEERRLKDISQVTAEQVRAVADKYLNQDHGVLAILGKVGHTKDSKTAEGLPQS